MVTCLAAIAIAAHFTAQSAPVRPLSLAGLVEHPESFTSLKMVVELPDGRVVAADPTEARFLLLDFATRTSRAMARAGKGPREFQTPGGVYADRAGGARLYDQNLQRYLPVRADGTVTDVEPLPFRPSSMANSSDGPDQFAPDTLGHFVSAIRPEFSPGAGTMRLVRRERDGAISVLADLLLPRSRELPSENPRIRRSQAILFSPVDVWALAPDGWVAVASPAPYRVRWFPPGGRPIEGPVLPYTPLPVTQADRDAAQHADDDSPPARQQVSGHGIRGNAAAATATIAPLFADAKPAFADQLALIDRGGRLWLARHVPPGEAPQYDVIDRHGAVVDRLRFPAATRLVGFGRGMIYLARWDEDDVQHVQRVPWR